MGQGKDKKQRIRSKATAAKLQQNAEKRDRTKQRLAEEKTAEDREKSRGEKNIMLSFLNRRYDESNPLNNANGTEQHNKYNINVQRMPNGNHNEEQERVEIPTVAVDDENEDEEIEWYDAFEEEPHDPAFQDIKENNNKGLMGSFPAKVVDQLELVGQDQVDIRQPDPRTNQTVARKKRRRCKRCLRNGAPDIVASLCSGNRGEAKCTNYTC